MTVRFCLAEYCVSPFYTGWWLYERETNDGQQNIAQKIAWDSWGWLNDTAPWQGQQRLHELCQRMGHNPPRVEKYSQKFAKWFAAQFPHGLRVAVRNRDGGRKYRLLEIMQSRPRQRRGVIRTIRGAAQSRRAQRKAI